MNEHTGGNDIRIQLMADNDLQQVVQIAEATPELAAYHPYAYWTMRRNAPRLCYVAKGEGVAGYVAGIAPFETQDRALLWQVGVAEDARRKGLARRLIAAFAEGANSMGLSEIAFTIEKDNAASRGLFHSVAAQAGLDLQAASSGETGDFGLGLPSEEIFVLRLR